MAALPSIPTELPFPIRVVHKPALCAKKKARNVFYNDRGFPDESDAYDHLLHNIHGGIVLRKKKFDAPALDQEDPAFNFVYSEANHGERLSKKLNLSHLQPKHSTRLTALIKKYWCVFDERGIFVPIRHHCIIDTRSAAPIAVKQIHYGQ